MSKQTNQLNKIVWDKIAKPKWTDSPEDFIVDGLPFKGIFRKEVLEGFDYERGGKKLTLKPVSFGFDEKITAKNSKGSRKDNIVSYKRVFGEGIDIEIETTKMRWRKKIKINSLDDLDIPDGAEFLEIKFELETTFDIEGWDKESELEFTKAIKIGEESQIESIKSWDSSPEVLDKDGNPIDKQQTHIGVLSKEDGKLYLTKKLPVEWLREAVFPIWTDVEIAYGTTYAFNSAATISPAIAALDSTHIVVAFQDAGDSNQGKAIIGVISSTDIITFGSEYVFNSGQISTVYQTGLGALDSTHFVIVYTDSGNNAKGTAIIGTVASGDEISYGSEYVFSSNTSTEYNSVAIIDSTHFVVAYGENQANTGEAIIGTVSSGNEIAYGTEYEFNSATSKYINISLLDSTHFVIVYKDDGGDDYGEAIVGVISSTDVITFDTGETTAFVEGNNYYSVCAALDSTHFAVVFRDGSDSNKAKAIIGIVSSGDTINFGSKYTFNTVLTYYHDFAIVEQDSTHFIVAYNTDNDDGVSFIGTVSNGNEISIGDEFTYNSARSDKNSIALLDSTHFAIAYMDDGGDDYGEAVIGTYTPPKYEETFASLTTLERLTWGPWSASRQVDIIALEGFATYTILEKEDVETFASLITLEMQNVRETVASLTTLEAPEDAVAQFASLITLESPGEETFASLTILEKPAVGVYAVLTELEKEVVSTFALLSNLQYEDIETFASLTLLEGYDLETFGLLSILEEEDVETFALISQLEREAIETFASLTLLEGYDLATFASLTILEKEVVETIATLITLESPGIETVALLTTLEAPAYALEQFASLITLESPGEGTFASLTTLEKEGSESFACLTTLEEEDVETFATLTTLELLNVRETFASLTILEAPAFALNQFASITSLEREDSECFASLTTLEFITEDTFGLLTVLEYTTYETFAGLTTLEKESLETIAVLITLESPGEGVFASLTTLEKENVRETFALKTALDKPMIAYPWQRKNWLMELDIGNQDLTGLNQE